MVNFKLALKMINYFKNNALFWNESQPIWKIDFLLGSQVCWSWDAMGPKQNAAVRAACLLVGLCVC